MEKNNLEKLYQERLKDFHEIPDERVWDSISASLDKKKKKRVIPIWWKLGGVAALLALLFYVINPFEESSVPVNQTTEVENSENEKLNESSNGQKPPNNAINHLNKTNNTEVAETEDSKENINVNKIQLAATDSNKKESGSSAFLKNEASAIDKVKENEPSQNFEKKEQVGIVENKNLERKDTQDLKNEIDFKKAIENSKITDLAASNVKEEKEKVISSHQKKALKKQLPNENEPVTDVVVAIEIKEEKKSIFEAIEEQKEEAVAKNEKNGKKWSVGPSIAPVYFDAVGKGSPIHSNFVENSKSGNINLSYGLTVAYNLGKRLKLRSGVHKVNYGYDTNEIVFSSSIASNSTGTIDNINFSQSSRTIVVESKKAGANSLTDRPSSDALVQNPERDGRMSQQLGYLEVPVELNYTLVDKKVGVNLIGGVSSLFLVDNAVALESEGLITEVGEANNVNSVNFSTNVGIGFSYEFSPKVQLSLEPVFKYQLNTFSDTAGSFNPYSVGVYSGVRFNF